MHPKKTFFKFISKFFLAVLIFALASLVFVRLTAKADSFIGFNEGGGTTVHDAENNTTGTITNAVWKSETECLSGTCLYFDGSGDYVSFGDDPDFDFVAATNFTIEFWFKTGDITTGTRVFISKYRGDDAEGGYKVYMSSDGKVNFGVDDDNSFGPDGAATSINAYDDNQWHHVVASKAGTTSLTLYVDAIRVNVNAGISGIGTLVNDDPLAVGIDADLSSNPFIGFIDELKIFTTTARTETQVKVDYQTASNTAGSSVTFGSTNSNFTNGLVGYWNLDEYSSGASQTNRLDSSGNNYTLTDNATTAAATGKFGNGSEHVPASSEYLSTATTLPNLKTISFWVNPDSNTNYYISLTSGAYITSNSGALAATGFTNPLIYVNGQTGTTLAANVWSLITVTTETAISADQFYIGRQGGNYFDGTLDDVRVYNRVLTPIEITNLHSLAPHPLGYWKLDENTGGFAYDSSGNGYTGTVNATYGKWSTGVFGSGIQIPTAIGSDTGAVEMGDVLDFSVTESFTLGSWVYLANANYGSGGFSVAKKSGGSATDTGYGFAIDGVRQVVFRVADGADQWTMTSATVDPGWHHIQTVFDRTSETNCSIYVDGQKVATTLSGTFANIGAIASATDLKLSTYGYYGALDEAKIYNYARTQSQTVEDMNAGHPIPGSPIGSQAAYWKFDEGYGTTANDSGPNSANLSFQTNPSWVMNGKLGNALDFESGSLNYISTPDSPALSITGDLTLSAWINPESITAATDFPIAGKWDSSYKDYLLSLYGDEIRLYLGSASNYVTTQATNLQTGTWYHILATYKASTQTVIIYVNGIPQSVAATGTIPTSITDNAGSFIVGSMQGPGTTEQIVAAADDGSELVGIQWYANGDGTVIAFGNNAGFGVHAGFRFQTVNIPQGSTILSAYLSLYGSAFAGTITNVHGKIVGDDADNAAAWRTGDGACGTNNCPSTITNVTTAQVDWDPTSWLTTGWNSSPDIASIISEIVNRGGWVANNNMRLAIRNDSSSTSSNVSFYDCNYSSCSRGAKLYVTYGTASSYYDGMIDELKVYASYFSPEQAKVEYNRGSAQVLGSLTTTSTGVADNSATGEYCVPGDTSTCNPPYAVYKMDDNTGTIANDTSGNNYNGTLNSMTNTNWVPGKLGSALTFNGSNQYVSLPTTFPQLGNTFTVSAWFNTNSVADHQAIVNRTEFTNISFDMGINADTDRIKIQTTVDGTIGTETLCYTPTGSIIPNTWYHVTAVKSSTHLKGYLNGVEACSVANTDAVYAGATYAPTIGRRSGTDTAYPFNGEIDDVVFFNYARTPAQVAWEFNHGNPIAWYKFDEASWTNNCSTDTVYNSASISVDFPYFHGRSCPNGGGQTTPETGKYGTAMHFDDSNDYVSVPDSLTLDLSPGVSIAAWVNTDANEADNVILSKGTSYEMGINADGDVYWDGVGAQVDDGSAKVLAGSWHHVVVTNDDTTATFYVDGVKTGIATAGVDSDNATDLYLGYDGTNYFDGLLDDVRLYTYPLTPTQVQTLYNSGATAKF